MRPAAVNKLVGVLLLIVAAAMLSPAVLAGGPDPECVQRCADQWYADKQACLDSLNVQLAQIDANTQACMDGCSSSPDPYTCQANCVHQGNVARASANNDYKKCVNRANTTAWNCYRGCQPSKSRP